MKRIKYNRELKSMWNRNYNMSKKGLITKIYGSQKYRSKIKGFKPPSYTKQELKDWLFSQKLFHELYENYKQNNYEKSLAPSIDRIDDYKCYSFDNIQLMTWEENCLKARRDRKNGVNNKINRAVIQLSLDGKKITEFHSIMEASRNSKSFSQNIFSCCIGELKTSGGYKWKFKKTTCG